MSKRKYAHMQQLLPEIHAMLAEGKTQREIEQVLGLTGDRPVHNLLKRERQKEKKLLEGVTPRPKKRASTQDIVTAQAHEIERLKMENKLLRDFLQLTGRK